MNLPELYILRHGETEWNATGRMQGRLHSPLTPKGRVQAQTQRRILESISLEGFEIISSPQMRALDTATEVFAARHGMIRTDDRLCEVYAGTWQGRLRSEIEIEGDLRSTVDGPLALYEQAEGGEGFVALRDRCAAFLADLTGPSVLVTHGITSRMLRAVVLDMPNSQLELLPGGQGVVFHLKDGVQTVLD